VTRKALAPGLGDGREEGSVAEDGRRVALLNPVCLAAKTVVRCDRKRIRRIASR
jgi:hypothetical protein